MQNGHFDMFAGGKDMHGNHSEAKAEVAREDYITKTYINKGEFIPEVLLVRPPVEEEEVEEEDEYEAWLEENLGAYTQEEIQHGRPLCDYKLNVLGHEEG